MGAILIEQVIVNLLENCVLHADGMTKIWLIVTEDGDQVKFSVEDDSLRDQGVCSSENVRRKFRVGGRKEVIPSEIWESDFRYA